MKKAALIALLVVFAISGCKKKINTVLDSPSGAGGEKHKLQVTATIFPPFDFTREVAGERVNITMLLPPASESHSFEPTPKDIINLQNSDVFIYTGGKSDSWVDMILSSVDRGNMKIIKMMDVVYVVEEELVEGMEEEKEEQDGMVYDDHLWTDPKNAALIVRAISDTLCEIDGANAGYYRQGADDYTGKLDKLDKLFRSAAEGGKRKTIVFGDRFPFRYFTDAYGLKYFAAFPGCSTETEPSAATIAFLINKIKEENIPVVFYIELSNERMADTLCEATGAKKLLLHSCHNISKKEFDAGVTFLELQTKNIDNLEEALK